MFLEIMFVFLGYLFGSIPVGFLIGKFFYNINVQEHGSKNIGMANVMRTCGKKAGLATMILDMTKGAIPAFGARIYFWVVSDSYSGFGENWNLDDEGLLLALIALFAIIGHSYPVWLKFKGGKSASVAAGVLLGINPLAFAIAFTLWLIMLKITKMTSLSNLVIGLLYPPALWFFAGTRFFNNKSWWAGGIGILAFSLMAWRHKENIKRIIEGKERKIGQKVPTSPETKEEDPSS